MSGALGKIMKRGTFTRKRKSLEQSTFEGIAHFSLARLAEPNDLTAPKFMRRGKRPSRFRITSEPSSTKT